VFAFIDHIDADRALTRDDVGNHPAQLGVVFAARPVGAVRTRQAADMGRENLSARASLHRPSCVVAPSRSANSGTTSCMVPPALIQSKSRGLSGTAMGRRRANLRDARLQPGV